MFRGFVISAAASGLLAILPAASAAATVAQILGSPSTYNGQHVDVRGMVERLEQKLSHKGNPYVTFTLCSNQCIHVFGFGTPGLSDGETITSMGLTK
ncbi:MAG: hypothetical protein WB810_11645 [Candidatus Cybelea sp.]